MNYFAHGHRYLEDPYFLAGTAVPDWLSVIDRRVRARSKLAVQWLEDADRQVAAVAAGVVRHHYDDAWFHQTRAFTELSLQFTLTIRRQLPEDTGFRPSFLGHILVEILLDGALIDEDPDRLDAYYAAMNVVDPVTVRMAVNRMATRPAVDLAELITRFCSERFLYDYRDDAKLLGRLNHVMGRVKLPALPTSFLEFLPAGRELVRERRGELLAGQNSLELEGD